MKYCNTKRNKKISRLKQLGALMCIIPTLVGAQEEILVFHNCENLFYPEDNPETLDDEYTVNGKKHWTFQKYNDKLNALAKTYISIEENKMPALIGLAEIENDKVLQALTMNTPLRKVNYKYIHYPSRDVRGIDVALLYDDKKFSVLEDYPLKRVSDREEDRTRDVLYVKGMLNDLKINVYVVHAPSRRENNIKKDLRKKIFQMILSHIDSLYLTGEENFIIMGDMNDNPWDDSVKEGFYINPNDKSKPILYNLMKQNKDKTGSYVYSGKPLSFDQFLVSQSVRNRIVFSKSCNSTFIYKPQFLIRPSKSSIDTPNPTYQGLRYKGGISDHFPIIMRIKTN